MLMPPLSWTPTAHVCSKNGQAKPWPSVLCSQCLGKSIDCYLNFKECEIYNNKNNIPYVCETCHSTYTDSRIKRRWDCSKCSDFNK